MEDEIKTLTPKLKKELLQKLAPSKKYPFFFFLIILVLSLLIFSLSVKVAFTPQSSPRPLSIDIPQPVISPLPTSTPVPSSTPSPSTPTPTSYNLNVLAIGYDPAQGDRDLVTTYFSSMLKGQTVASYEDNIFATTANNFRELSKGRINFTIKKKLRITNFQTYPDGFNYTVDSFSKCVWGNPSFDPTGCDIRKSQFDYVKFIAQNNICSLITDNNIDAVWMVSVPYVMAWETFMIGPNYGFPVNGESYATPGCLKHFIVLDGTYDRPETVLHSFGHQIEATMVYLTSIWSDVDKNKYWDSFARWGTGNDATYKTCGNTHFPTNAKVGYDYSNKTNEVSTCPDWKNFPDLKGTTVTINCTAWGCDDPGWQKYWFASLPASPGAITLTGKYGNQIQFKKDWWYYLLDPDKAIQFVTSNSTVNSAKFK